MHTCVLETTLYIHVCWRPPYAYMCVGDHLIHTCVLETTLCIHVCWRPSYAYMCVGMHTCTLVGVTDEGISIRQ